MCCLTPACNEDGYKVLTIKAMSYWCNYNGTEKQPGSAGCGVQGIEVPDWTAERKDPLSREEDDVEKLTRLVWKVRAWGELTWSLCRKTPEEIRAGSLFLSVGERAGVKYPLSRSSQLRDAETGSSALGSWKRLSS